MLPPRSNTSLPAPARAHEVDGIVAERGKPAMIVSNNGTERTAIPRLSRPRRTASNGTTSRLASRSERLHGAAQRQSEGRVLRNEHALPVDSVRRDASLTLAIDYNTERRIPVFSAIQHRTSSRQACGPYIRSNFLQRSASARIDRAAAAHRTLRVPSP